MNPMIETNILLLTAASIGFVHTIIGPDHFLPFIMISKARSWSFQKTIFITLLCGMGQPARQSCSRHKEGGQTGGEVLVCVSFAININWNRLWDKNQTGNKIQCIQHQRKKIAIPHLPEKYRQFMYLCRKLAGQKTS